MAIEIATAQMLKYELVETVDYTKAVCFERMECCIQTRESFEAYGPKDK